MQITIEIPDAIADDIQGHWRNLPQKVLEALAIEGYRANVLNRTQVQQLLALPSLYAVDGFLKQSGVFLPYDEADFEQDLLTMQQIRDSGHSAS